jgi:tetratricopeptide (TPR) repeat protein
MSSASSLNARARHNHANNNSNNSNTTNNNVVAAAPQFNTVEGLKAFLASPAEPPLSVSSSAVSSSNSNSVLASSSASSGSPSSSGRSNESAAKAASPVLAKQTPARPSLMQRVSRALIPTKRTKAKATSDLVARVHQCFQTGKYSDALDTLRVLLRDRPDAQAFAHKIYFNMALCHSVLGRPKEAMASLRSAIDLGYDKLENFQHPLLAPLHDDPDSGIFELLSTLLKQDDDVEQHLTLESQLPLPKVVSIGSVVTQYATAPKLTDFDAMSDDADGDGDGDVAVKCAVVVDDGDDDDDDEALIDRRKVAPPVAQPQPQHQLSEACKALSETAARLAQAGRAADARRVYARMLELSPRHPIVYVLHANLEAQVHDPHEALRLLKLAADCGFSNWASIASKPAFAKVFELPDDFLRLRGLDRH